MRLLVDLTGSIRIPLHLFRTKLFYYDVINYQHYFYLLFEPVSSTILVGFPPMDDS